MDGRVTRHRGVTVSIDGVTYAQARVERTTLTERVDVTTVGSSGREYISGLTETRYEIEIDDLRSDPYALHETPFTVTVDGVPELAVAEAVEIFSSAEGVGARIRAFRVTADPPRPTAPPPRPVAAPVRRRPSAATTVTVRAIALRGIEPRD